MKDKLIYIADMYNDALQLLKQNLESYNFDVKVFDNGDKLVINCIKLKPDFVIMDINLHGIDGLEVCRKLRQECNTRDIPIIFLTEKKDEFDVLLGLEVGADDYMVKPFSIRELHSRIKAIWRRTRFNRAKELDNIKLNNLIFDIQGRTVSNGNISIKFPQKEFELLMFMIINKGKVLNRNYIIKQIWGSDRYNDSRTLDVHIRYLRKKLDVLDNKHLYIESIRKSGYRFIDKKVDDKVG
ncbi:two component transcriptional regulator, winged helix family [Ruminiclostridium papyrosolvens DSM 2782]|uniref:Stage 0 sporulation protein A homolog n=1 Tax=Ruminiclostridium papyrosolvens DSM 2782 TaxID=588581 RepID=F1TDB8_9FIRM|nr:response regulator transcription factor [Ruminiclostridium papyrosolvens]EGD47556.1 two component transcriptional regulator, winged helix family [Ruminiclostridium papyrosolvens DSM 2782]WES36498.1 response regulator transcription factor [Ruminiclostridium papyrosolvens DSM 2782]